MPLLSKTREHKFMLTTCVNFPALKNTCKLIDESLRDTIGGIILFTGQTIPDVCTISTQHIAYSPLISDNSATFSFNINCR